jgi:exocyst complex component 6
MPMPINSLDEYDKVVNVSWYTPEKERSELEYVASHLARAHR